MERERKRNLKSVYTTPRSSKFLSSMKESMKKINFNDFENFDEIIFNEIDQELNEDNNY